MIMDDVKVVLWVMMGAQMLGWAYFSSKGGNLSNKAFFFFTASMMLGQIGAGIETYVLRAWGACAVQIWFFCFTFWGGLNRFRQRGEER